MELCHQLRLHFSRSDSSVMPVKEIREYVNKALKKDYTREQIIIGMDYAGFVRIEENYLVQIKSADRINP